MSLADRMLACVARPHGIEPNRRTRLIDHLLDTLAVAAAGWNEPVSVKLRAAFPGANMLDLEGNGGRSAAEAALVLATACHALDFDDVHLESVTHPSAVLLPALLSLQSETGAAPARLLEAYQVGLELTAFLGAALGFSHYKAGWHATGTIGAIAGAGAGAFLLELSQDQARCALSIGAAQSGGLQLNFGYEAKPVQAGLAAAAAVRAVLMAKAGVTAAQDIFSERGFLDLYAPQRNQGDVVATISEGVSVKLFPCCYAAHRMVAAAIEIHRSIGVPPGDAEIYVQVPRGLMVPLSVSNPLSGAMGKFCATYIVAATLISGALRMQDFDDAAVHRPYVRDLMARVHVTEVGGAPGDEKGISFGKVALRVQQGERNLGMAEVEHYPGSPESPPTREELEAKLHDCLQIYARSQPQPITVEAFRDTLSRRCGNVAMVDA